MIIHGDCRKIFTFKRIRKVDVAITDPPYSPHVHASATSTRTGGVGPRGRDLGFEAITPDLVRFVAAAATVVKRWTVTFSDLEGTHLWREEMAWAGVEYVREVPCAFLPHYWHRWSQPQITGDRPPTGAEAVLTFHRMHPEGPRGGVPRPVAKRWNGSGGRTMYDARAMRGQDKHPTEKPLDLCLTLVADFSDRHEVVADYFTGRGTIPLACRLLGRGCVATESDAGHAAFASHREKAALCPRDAARAAEWADWYETEARTVPEPTQDSMRPTWERAQRRIESAKLVRQALAGKIHRIKGYE